MKSKSIQLLFDPKKKLSKLDFMNTIASVVQILHTDPEVGVIDIQISENKKIKHSFPIKLV